MALPQLQAFQNQIPFGVPNQLPSITPQNAQGLRLPGGQVSFNLPRFQMPGMDLNFAGNAGMSQSMGGGPGVPVGGINFSITRQASSDPIQNIIGDLQDPLGGMSASFGGATAPPPPAPALKQQMLSAAPQPPPEDPYGTMALAQGYQPPIFGLRNKMLGFT